MRFVHLVVRDSGARGVLVAAIALGAAGGGVTVGLLALINRALQAESGAGLAGFGLPFAGLCALLIGSRVTSQYLLARLGHGAVKELRLRLCRTVVATPLRRLEEIGPHRVLATLTEDVNAITMGFMYAPIVGLNGTMMLGCLVYLGWLDLRLFGLLLVALVVGIASYQLPASLGLARFRAAREQQDELFGHFRALLDGIKELKLHRRRRGAFLRFLAAAAERTRRLRVRAAVIYNTAAAWGQLLFFVVIGLLLFARPGGVAADRDTLTGYTLVLLYMMGPLQILLDSFAILGQADVAVDKVERLGLSLGAGGSSGAVAEAAAGEREHAPGWRRLELAGVTHTYRLEGRDGEFTLGPVDLTLRPGELVFLVGGNGSGKTSLAKILAGLYPPERGAIRLDGVPVTGAAEWEAYRQLFSAVFADFFVFERLLGLDRPRDGGPRGEEPSSVDHDLDRRAARYLAELHLDRKVSVEAGELSATELSRGQRKRLALLTAYLEDRPVYLFDEWAADQDPAFKEVFYRTILPELRARGKAVVAITHDDRYFGLADRVVKLEEGAVVYDGPPVVLPLAVPASSPA